MEGSLRIGKFKAGGADQNLGNRQHAVGNELPGNGHDGSRLQPVLKPRHDQESDGTQGDARAEPDKRFGEPHHVRINENGDERDENHHENGIGCLYLLRADGPCSGTRQGNGDGNHVVALGHPGGSRLVKNGPERDDERENGKDFQDVPRVRNGVFPAEQSCLVPAPAEKDGKEHPPEAAAACTP